MKTHSKEIIEDEEFSLKQLKEELKSLKSKWIKIPSVKRLISFLEHAIKEKEKFIKKLKGFKYEK